MKGMEEHAFAAGMTTAGQMMEDAGQAVVDAILSQWPDLRDDPPRTLVLCGPGNNGGDGYVIARLLLDLGWPVEVFAYADSRTDEAQAMRRRWEARDPVASQLAPQTDLMIDALFGIGRPRPISAIVPRARYRVAVDGPTGIDLDTGLRTEPAFDADLTVTFHAAKPGHFLGAGPAATGRLRIADLGLAPASDLHLAAPDIRLLQKGDGHKYDHGHAIILGGPPGRGGAARLSARAALRIGAGLVTLVAPPEAQAENAARLDAIMLRTDPLADLLTDKRITGICLGPGMGIDRARDAIPAILAAGRPTVLDADALTALGTNPDLHPRCILTPHQGEFARMFPDLAAAMTRTSKVDAVREAAGRAGCTILLKGHDTVIAEPSGRAAIVDGRGAGWLATAGSGDVLAGMIAGLLARGATPFAAATTAACLHVEAARSFGPGLIAEDIPEELPKVLRALLP
nr:NAD(P)H-hydrate dehydratase [Rhodobacter xinxiangensis]